MPIILDVMNYYTADEGYRVLSDLGDDGRNAYRLANYADFVLPVLIFLSLSLPNLALGRGPRYLILPFVYLVFDYFENIAEKYVLEIYPERNDFAMKLACYAGLVKISAVYPCLPIIIIDVVRRFWQRKNRSQPKPRKQKAK